MKTPPLATCLVLLWSVSCLAESPKGEGKDSITPGRFEKEIQAFEARDRQQPPPTGAVVCIGSSSMKGWHPTIAEDLAPLTVIPRGFGGSGMNDALRYVDRIVIAYKPRAVVLYEGDNDIAGGMAPARIVETFRVFVEKVHKELPETRVYVLSIKPSISRWKLWPRMKEANHLLAQECSKDKRLIYVDVAGVMLDGNGEPRKEIFKKDNLHMTRAGYELWRDVLKPVLIKAELPFEPQKGEGKP
jgi:lysophospholipase L1-like esterase